MYARAMSNSIEAVNIKPLTIFRQNVHETPRIEIDRRRAHKTVERYMPKI